MSISLQPQNQNLAQVTKFQLNFSRVPHLNFFCTKVNIPGVSIKPLPQPTAFIDLHVPGNKLEYDTFDIQFLVDEDYRSWFDVHDWIRGMAFPTDFEEYQNLKNQSRYQPEIKPVQYSEASLSIFTNKNNPNLMIHFREVFPVSLSSIGFDVELNADTIITATASFKFAYFDLERV